MAHKVITAESAEQFKEHINGDKTVVVDFTASWCGPCQMMKPFFEEKSTKYENIVFLKVDVDELDDVAQDCGVQAMPTFHFYQKGEKVAEIVGAGQDKLLEKLELYK